MSIEFLEHYVDGRPVLAEPPHDLGQQPRADGLERADAQRAGLSGLQRLQIGLCCLQPGDDRVGMTKEQSAGLGQRDGAGASGALDELLADDPLEGRDLLADRRLRVAEALGGPSEGALARDRLQGGQVPDLDPKPTIRFHNRNEQYYDLC